MWLRKVLSLCATAAVAGSLIGASANAQLGTAGGESDGGLHKVNHLILLMQENHSFDNYLDVLALADGSPYHGGECASSDHTCVDGLNCTRDATTGAYTCANSNRDDDGSTVFAFHGTDFCVKTDVNHAWVGTHEEGNFNNPNAGLVASPNDGFVLVNDATNQPDSKQPVSENATEDETMSFYNEQDIGFYYSLAETFAIDDRYFCSALGPTFPNRSFEMAATAFGHLTTSEFTPPTPDGYKPITGTIFDLLDKYSVSWLDYSEGGPGEAATFRNPADPSQTGHFGSVATFMTQAAAGTLPSVAFIELANSEHPGGDIRVGQHDVAQVIAALRNGPNWKDSILFLTYDEHGGFYDHVAPAAAPQGGARNPDGISPGQCADASNPPSSEQPGGGVNCKISQSQEAQLCPGFTPTGAFPASCADFDQLGFRVPFIAVSPFAKPHYVSHTVGDHTSMLALIEKRFMSDSAKGPDEASIPHLTARDANAGTLEDMFDFDGAPSKHAVINASLAPSPATPCAQ
jgi:phospholipase C